MNIRVAIVIILITISAYLIQNVITRAMYSNIIGYTQEESLSDAIDFVAHQEFNLVIEEMPEEIGQILSAIRVQTNSNNNAAITFLTYRHFLIVVILAILIPILLAISIAINRRITSPIRSLISATRTLSQGDLSTRAKPNEHYWDNYSIALADNFNSMAGSLEQLEKERQTMIADIAHELRTPITTMQLRLEAVQDGIDPLNKDLIRSLHSETELLSSLIVDLRTLSLAEAKQLNLNQHSFNLFTLSEQIATRFYAMAQKKNISTKIEVAPDTYLFADAERINQVLNNLMNNAIRHTPENGTITLASDSNAQGITIQVINTGSALPQEELKQLFNRFYRSGQGRVRAEGGSGLGLAIVKALTELHGGTVSVQNHDKTNIMFSIFLPQNHS